MNSFTKRRLFTALLLVIIVPAGFYTKFYSGPAQLWVSDSFGGFLYEIFWCLVFFFISPGVRTFAIAGIVFLLTCLLEFLQLWHPAFLELLRSNFICRTILGNSFNCSDFIYYFLGSAGGWFILNLIQKRYKK